MIAKFETPASIPPSGSGSGSGSYAVVWILGGIALAICLYQFGWKPYQLKQKAKEQEQAQ